MTIERYAHLVGGARMAARREDGVVDARPPRLRRPRPVRGRRQRAADPGLGEPGADDHGAGRAGRGPAGRRGALRPGARGGVVTARPVTDVRTAVYRFPTPTPEADGTLAWDATTAVTVEVGGRRAAPGWAGPTARRPPRPLIDGELADVVRGRDAFDVPGAWAAMHRAGRNLGTRGLFAQALSRASTSRSGTSRRGCSSVSAGRPVRPAARPGARLRLRRVHDARRRAARRAGRAAGRRRAAPR